MKHIKIINYNYNSSKIMHSYKLKIDKDLLNKIVTKLDKYTLSNNNENLLYSFKIFGTSVLIYKTLTLLIQGSEVQRVCKFLELEISDEKQNNNLFSNQSLAGSDEVGTGDFFGGIVVCACYVDKKNIPQLMSYGIQDSKKISDQNIKILFDKIRDLVEFEYAVLDPKKYNDWYAKYQNMNVIKSIMHNQCFWSLYKAKNCHFKSVIDEFVDYNLYKAYLLKNNIKLFNIDCSTTKAESKYISVACASIIARYFFLEQIQHLSDLSKMQILLGSSNANIKALASKLKKKIGNDKMKEFVKLNFKTIKEI